MKGKAYTHLTLFAAFVFILGACRANISRNDDGSLNVETTISQQELQEMIGASIADPLIRDLTVSLQQGYVLVTGERQRLNDTSKTDSLSFRLDLGVSSGQLTATISNALLDRVPFEQNRVDHWNQTIASGIVILGKKNPNSSLQSVNVAAATVTMTWSVSR